MTFGGGPGDVPAWPREIGDKPAPDWTGDANENNADGGGYVLGRQGVGSSPSQHQRHRKADQFGRSEAA
jgi:hypothetical protein